MTAVKCTKTVDVLMPNGKTKTFVKGFSYVSVSAALAKKIKPATKKAK